MVAMHDEVGHREVRILEESTKSTSPHRIPYSVTLRGRGASTIQTALKRTDRATTPNSLLPITVPLFGDSPLQTRRSVTVVYRQDLIDGGIVFTSRELVPKRTLGPLEPDIGGRIEGSGSISAVLRYGGKGVAIYTRRGEWHRCRVFSGGPARARSALIYLGRGRV